MLDTYTMFRGSVKGTGYPLHLTVPPFTYPPVCHRVPSHFNRTPPAYSTVDVTCINSQFWHKSLRCQSHNSKLINNFFCHLILKTWGHAVAHFTEAPRYEPRRPRVRFPTASLEFYVDTILPASLRPRAVVSSGHISREVKVAGA